MATCIQCSYSEKAARNSRILLKVTTSPPNLGGLSPPIVKLTSGLSRPPARLPPLRPSQLSGWTLPSACARAFLAAVESPIAFSWCPKPTTARRCRPPSETHVGHVSAVSRIDPIQLNCTDSRPPARWYQLRAFSLVGSECVCLQCNYYFFICQGIGLRPSRSSVKSSPETQTGKVELASQLNLQPLNAQWYDHSGTISESSGMLHRHTSTPKEQRGSSATRTVLF